LVDVTVGGSTPPIVVPHVPVPIPPIKIGGKVAAPRDPSLSLSIVSPLISNDRVTFDQVLNDVFAELQIDSVLDTDDEEAASTLFQYRDAAPGWEVSIDEEFRNLEVGEGEQVSFTVNVQPGAPGFYPFAVVATDRYSPSQFSVSNVVVAQLDDETQSFRLLFGDDESEESDN